MRAAAHGAEVSYSSLNELTTRHGSTSPKSQLSRRDFLLRSSIGFGVALATACGPAAPSQPAPTAAPAAARAGGGGPLSLLWWQAPTILNAHLSLATKDVGAIRIYAEPLADFNAQNQLVPVLSAEIPSVENGGVARDGTSVTWKLKQGVTWHDGQQFTASDVAFTYRYLSEPTTSATTLGYYQDVASVDAIAPDTVKITFKHPVAAWFNPFTGLPGQILPEHVLKDAVGAAAKDAPFNLKPIGTGPYKVTDFKPGDMVMYALNPEYHVSGKPFFDTVTLKGGGDATSAARAVLQTGEADWAWNLQIEPGVLNAMQNAGRGEVVTWVGGGTEKLIINHTDPETQADDQFSSYRVPHPHFKELNVRQALAYAIQRDVIASQLYGPGGKQTAYTMNENAQYMPPGLTWEYNLDKARALLDEVAAAPGPDGIRVLNGRRMSWLYSSSTNSVRQKEQEIIKAALQQIGIEVEIKAVDASAYFSASNADSFQQLKADLGMETNAAGVYPLLWYLRYLSADPAQDIAQKDNNWSGRNIMRYQNPQLNDLYAQAAAEVDPTKYTQIFQHMQQLVVTDVADIGLVARNNVAAASKRLTGYQPTPWAPDIWDIQNWRTAA
ncbi:MAG: peptide ABC transporter substrate-binding protein [Chloroflexi bacterium]|nr:peptide ABC transporter substrate-binding protein [Chloroflexota bacterium]